MKKIKIKLKLDTRLWPIPTEGALVNIYFIQTNSCTLFKTHSHSRLKL